MHFCPGANHAPHHAPQEFIDKYKGKFDDGYEAYREWVLPRMIERGILPEGTQLTPMNPMSADTANPDDAVRPWDALSDDEKRLFSRMAEVYAAFSEYTDHQVGRIIDYLEQTGQLDNTLIFYAADNGASGEGSPNGMVNENTFFNAWPSSIDDNLAMIDQLGSPETYNHYPTGWAMAFSTPFRMFKRYSYQGGVCDPLVIHWPKGMRARGEVRSQYHHCTDIVPTIYECCGITPPDTVLGYEQSELPGVSMRYSFDAPDAPTEKHIQYYEMLGTRGIWRDGWKAVTEHAPMPSDKGHFDQDRWQLFHTDEDRSEATDLSEQHPDKVKELVDLWFEEAKKYNVLPLCDLGLLDYISYEFHPPVPKSGLYTFFPDTAEIPERSAVNFHGVSYKILAEVQIAAQAALRLQLHRPQARAAPRVRTAGARPVRARSRVHQGEPGRAPRVTRDRQAVRRGGRRDRGSTPHPDRPLLPVRRGPLHRTRHRRRRQRAIHPVLPVRGRHDPPSRGQHRR